MSQKWHAAIVGSITSFSVVILSYRLRWSRWSFWAAIAICLTIHSFAVWVVFRYALMNVQIIGILAWSPIALVEMFLLLLAVKVVEERLTGRHEIVKLS